VAVRALDAHEPQREVRVGGRLAGLGEQRALRRRRAAALLRHLEPPLHRSSGGEELFEAGDAYYVGPGHTPVLYAGTEVVEFSPTEELGRTMEVVTKNMEAAGT
jgi:hypothetical protein